MRNLVPQSWFILGISQGLEDKEGGKEYKPLPPSSLTQEQELAWIGGYQKGYYKDLNI